MRTRVDPPEVVVLSLTYGRRTEMLEQMARGVAAEGVRRVMVFGNGLAPDVAATTREMAERIQRECGVQLDLHEADENLGSAEGYAALIEAALRIPAMQAIWFLDDDNVPEPGSLAIVLNALGRAEGGAVTALRRDRAYMLEAAETGDVRRPASGEAFGKDIRRLAARAAAKLLRRSPPKPSGSAAKPALVAFPRVPYGGLLVPAALARQVGPPRPDFVLYADDYDYSERLANAAGLYLVPDAFITDLETSWNATGEVAPRQSQTARLATMTPDFRLFYALRNALYLDRVRTKAATWPWFLVNLTWLVGESGGRALLRGRPRNLRCILAAANDGLRGRLGRHPRYPLP